MERNSSAKHAQSSTVEGWVNSCEEGHRDKEELQGFACFSLGSGGMGDTGPFFGDTGFSKFFLTYFFFN